MADGVHGLRKTARRPHRRLVHGAGILARELRSESAEKSVRATADAAGARPRAAAGKEPRLPACLGSDTPASRLGGADLKRLGWRRAVDGGRARLPGRCGGLPERL